VKPSGPQLAMFSLLTREVFMTNQRRSLCGVPIPSLVTSSSFCFLGNWPSQASCLLVLISCYFCSQSGKTKMVCVCSELSLLFFPPSYLGLIFPWPQCLCPAQCAFCPQPLFLRAELCSSGPPSPSLQNSPAQSDTVTWASAVLSPMGSPACPIWPSVSDLQLL
jgi:hypothetical protein